MFLNQEDLNSARAKLFGKEADRSRGIGTQKEKTLHAVLKHSYASDSQFHEVRLDGFIVDIYDGNEVIEIQTQGFNKLRPKLSKLLERHIVHIVYPIPARKWLIWVDMNTGELSKKRKSPKQGSRYHAFFELYKLKMFLLHPNLRIHLVLLDLEEYRYLNGWSEDKKRGSSRCERLPVALCDETILSSATDYRCFIPENLSELFTAKDYQKKAGLTLRQAQLAVNVLKYLGVIGQVGKQGRSHLYKKH